MSDQYAYWREARKGNFLPMKEAHPESGIYRARNGDPVMFNRDANGVLTCQRNGKDVPGNDDRMVLWVSVAKSPVAKEDFKARLETGRWPDEPEALEQRSNMPSDPFEAIKAEIEDRTEQAAKWLASTTVDTQTKADLARNMQSQLIALGKKADAMRDAEGRPHLEAKRAVDAKFKPLTELADKFSAGLKSAFQKFMVAEEDRRKEEAKKKFEAERAATELARKAVEEARAKKMADDPIAAMTEPAPELPELPYAPEPVKINAGGQVGRAAGLKTNYIGHIEDYGQALAHFAEHPDVKAAVEKLVKAAVRVGKETTKIPGVKVVAERVAA